MKKGILILLVLVTGIMQAQTVYVPLVPTAKRYGLSPIQKEDEQPAQFFKTRQWGINQLEKALQPAAVAGDAEKKKWIDIFNEMAKYSKLESTAGVRAKGNLKAYCLQCYGKDYTVNRMHASIKGINKAYRQAIYELHHVGLPNEVDQDSIERVKILAKTALYDEWVATVPFRLFPGRNSVFTEKFFGNSTRVAAEAFKNGYLRVDPRIGTSYYNEFVAGYLGPFRLSLGGMLAQSKEAAIDSNFINSTGSAEELNKKIDSLKQNNQYNNSLQQLLGGGGNLVVDLRMPLFDISTCRRDFRIYSTLYNRTGIQLPSIGTQSSKVAFVNENGIMGAVAANFSQIGKWNRDKNAELLNLSAFIEAKVSWITGDREFIENFGLNYDAEGGKQRYFGYAEITGGINVYMFRIFISKQWFFGQDFNTYSDLKGTYKPAVVSVGTQVLLSSFWN